MDPWPTSPPDLVDRFRFEPMPGRAMREYVVLPPEVAADADATRQWIERAADYVRTLPPKKPRPKRKRQAR